MSLFEIVFRTTRDDHILNLSKKYPSLKILGWCNRQHDVLEVIVSNPEEYPLVIKELPKPEGIVASVDDSERSHLIAKVCSCMKGDSVVKLIGDLAMLHVPPVMTEKGWDHHRVVAFRHGDWEELLSRLEKAGYTVEVLRKVPFNDFIASPLMLSADTLFSRLTEKQMEAFLAAYRNGYYKVPREVDVKTIAAKRHVPRTTFQEHLSKAENKLAASLAPYVQLFVYKQRNLGQQA
jgi:predicted DNA binding protein